MCEVCDAVRPLTQGRFGQQLCVRISFFHRHLRLLDGNVFLTSRLGFLNTPQEISLDSSPQMRHQTSLNIRYKSTNAKVKKTGQNINIWVNIYDFKLLYDWKSVVNVKHWPLLKGEIIKKHNFSTSKKCIRSTGVSDTGTCCHGTDQPAILIKPWCIPAYYCLNAGAAIPPWSQHKLPEHPYNDLLTWNSCCCNVCVCVCVSVLAKHTVCLHTQHKERGMG